MGYIFTAWYFVNLKGNFPFTFFHELPVLKSTIFKMLGYKYSFNSDDTSKQPTYLTAWPTNQLHKAESLRS
jgi:hypothetical protein